MANSITVSENHRPMLATLQWFNPLVEFGPISVEQPSSALPLLLVLPGLDGSGVTAWTQYPELARSYDVRALSIAPSDRSSYDEVVADIASKVTEAADAGREVYVLGESMGAGFALTLGSGMPVADRISGLVLVSPATGWDRTWLGRMSEQLVALPDLWLTLAITLTSYQLLDRKQLTTTMRRITTGERSPLLEGDERTAYAWRVVRELPARLASPAGTVRHRIAQWAGPSMRAGFGERLAALRTPLLVVAGTADLRVPAEEEARRLQAEAPVPTVVHLVDSAGHAGVTDDRLDLRLVMEGWRRTL